MTYFFKLSRFADISERLIAFRNKHGVKQSEIAYRLGVAQTTYSKIERGLSALTPDHLLSLAKSYGLNPTWLLLGRGSMLIQDVITPINIHQVNVMVPAVAFAGYTAGWPDHVDGVEPIIIPGISGEARTFEIAGESMTPLLQPGDWVCCRRLEDPKYIKPGQVYVVVSNSQGIFAKHIQLMADRIRCISANTDYNGVDLDLEDVREIWEVIIRITKHLGQDKPDGGLAEKVDYIERFLRENFNQFRQP